MSRHRKQLIRSGRKVFAALVLGVGVAGGAHAQTQCGDHQNIVAVLLSKYSETLQTRAMDGKGRMVETYAARSGSWTILVVVPSGPACVVASGQGYTVVADPMPASGVPA